MDGAARHPAVADALFRPSSAGAADGLGRLSAWDDYPIHQSAAPVTATAPALPGWAERFYFNLLRPSGELAAIVGGGVYPNRGVSECYFCRFDGDRQINVRSLRELPRPGEDSRPGPFSFRCETPLLDWSVSAEGAGVRLAGRFAGELPPYLFDPHDVPPSEPGGEFDSFRHFVAAGRWELDHTADLGHPDEFLGVRDRTWGVRTRRIRLHNWYVFMLEGRLLTLIHQELADGSVFFSEGGVVHPDGRTEQLRIAAHDLRFDPQTREIVEGAVSLSGGNGPLELRFERVGRGIRLAGAGYDDNQGLRDAGGGEESDEYDLADPVVAKRTGRGTMDAGAGGQVTGEWNAEGIGVVETAVARNHVRYGEQIA